jgi:hypothetical protein
MRRAVNGQFRGLDGIQLLSQDHELPEPAGGLNTPKQRINGFGRLHSQANRATYFAIGRWPILYAGLCTTFAAVG